MHERGDKVEAIGCCQRNHNLAECLISSHQTFDIERAILSRTGVYVLSNAFPASDGMGDSEVNSVAGTPQSDDIAEAKKDHGKRIDPF